MERIQDDMEVGGRKLRPTLLILRHANTAVLLGDDIGSCVPLSIDWSSKSVYVSASQAGYRLPLMLQLSVKDAHYFLTTTSCLNSRFLLAK